MSLDNFGPEDFKGKEKIHYDMLNKYYRHLSKKNVRGILSIINGESKISLRILDHFVTRYAKENNVSYMIDTDEGKELFNVHINYKAQLQTYRKRYFDPFRRKGKFLYNYDNHDTQKQVKTTIGQLNFFRWILSQSILDFVANNYEKIEVSINKANKETRSIKKTHKKLKDGTLSKTFKVGNADEVRVRTKKKEEKYGKNKKKVTLLVTFD